jgi:preprotein translocase subunit SecA
MFNWIIKKIIGTKNQRTVRKLMPVVAEINRIEAQLQNEPEEALRERTQKWQAQFRAFHTPPFLGGVGLRIADEAAVDACLESGGEVFRRVEVAFPDFGE